MERINKIFSILLLYTLIQFAVYAEEEIKSAQPQTPAPQTVNFSQCIETFNIGYEKLYLLTEAAIASNNFTIEEIQSQSGYIVFSVVQYKFLATVMTFGKDKAILKITPCNNNYTFPIAIIKNIFKYIEANQLKKF